VSVFEYQHLRFHQVSLVGIIKNVLKRANDLTYLVDDMTFSGEVVVKVQGDDTEDIENEDQQQASSSSSHSSFIENQYVRVYGILKNIGGQRILQSFKILPIRDLNEITNHMLECMNASVHYTAKNNGGETSSHAAPLKSTNNNYNSPEDGLTALQRQISTIIKNAKDESGIHLNEICAYLKTTNQKSIREALEFLSTEGHVYSTVDDEHFKAAD